MWVGWDSSAADEWGCFTDLSAYLDHRFTYDENVLLKEIQSCKQYDPTAESYLKPLLELNVVSFLLAKTSHAVKFKVKGKVFKRY